MLAWFDHHVFAILIHSGFKHECVSQEFAGPCAQGVLDPITVPRPISLGCAGLFWFNNLLIWPFLGTSAHEGCHPPATRWIVVVGRGSKKSMRIPE